MRSEPYFHLLGLPMGPPQFVAGVLLLCFLAQCGWLALGEPIGVSAIVPDTYPLPPKHEAARPVLAMVLRMMSIGAWLGLSLPALVWITKAAFAVVGALLGAAVWYVSRRLYGTAGGLAALVLYCFSPMPYVAMRGLDLVAVASLGLFGVVFISIAVSHTLYAPPRGNFVGEVRHRWKRVTILGLAIVLMVGTAPELTFMVAVAVGFMFYLVPHRRRDASVLMLAALAMATIVLLGLGGARSLTGAEFSPIAGWRAPRYVLHTDVAGASWTLTIISLAAVVVYLVSRRSRYFGNTAPLLAFALTIVLGFPRLGHFFVGPFPAWSLPLLFVFVGGIFADLIETEWRWPATVVFVVMAASLAVLELIAVAQHPFGSGS